MYSERFTSSFSFHPHSTPATAVWRGDKRYDLWPSVMEGYCLRGKRDEIQKHKRVGVKLMWLFLLL